MDKPEVKALCGSPVAYHVIFARIAGDAVCGLFMSQLLYWQGKGADPQWERHSQQQWTDEVGLSRREVDRARSVWAALGALLQERRGYGAKLHYRLNLDRLGELVSLEWQKGVRRHEAEINGRAEEVEVEREEVEVLAVPEVSLVPAAPVAPVAPALSDYQAPTMPVLQVFSATGTEAREIVQYVQSKSVHNAQSTVDIAPQSVHNAQSGLCETSDVDCAKRAIALTESPTETPPESKSPHHPPPSQDSRARVGARVAAREEVVASVLVDGKTWELYSHSEFFALLKSFYPKRGHVDLRDAEMLCRDIEPRDWQRVLVGAIHYSRSSIVERGRVRNLCNWIGGECWVPYEDGPVLDEVPEAAATARPSTGLSVMQGGKTSRTPSDQRAAEMDDIIERARQVRARGAQRFEGTSAPGQGLLP